MSVLLTLLHHQRHMNSVDHMSSVDRVSLADHMTVILILVLDNLFERLVSDGDHLWKEPRGSR